MKKKFLPSNERKHLREKWIPLPVQICSSTSVLPWIRLQYLQAQQYVRRGNKAYIHESYKRQRNIMAKTTRNKNAPYFYILVLLQDRVDHIWGIIGNLLKNGVHVRHWWRPCLSTTTRPQLSPWPSEPALTWRWPLRLARLAQWWPTYYKEDGQVRPSLSGEWSRSVDYTGSPSKRGGSVATTLIAR